MVPIIQIHDKIIKKRVTRFHVIQSLLAGAYVLSAFTMLHFFHNELAMASLGASAFIVFAAPSSQSSRPRFLIGGYCLGALGGMACGGLALSLQNRLPLPAYIPACALAVFVSMFLMTVMDFEHPPAVAFAVAVALDPNPVLIGFAGLGCILLLSVIKMALAKHLQDL